MHPHQGCIRASSLPRALVSRRPTVPLAMTPCAWHLWKVLAMTLGTSATAFDSRHEATRACIEQLRNPWRRCEGRNVLWTTSPPHRWRLHLLIHAPSWMTCSLSTPWSDSRCTTPRLGLVEVQQSDTVVPAPRSSVPSMHSRSGLHAAPTSSLRSPKTR